MFALELGRAAMNGPEENTRNADAEYIPDFYDVKAFQVRPEPTARRIMLCHLRLANALALVTLLIGIGFAFALAFMLITGQAPPDVGWASFVISAINAVGLVVTKLHRDSLLRLNDMRLTEEKMMLTDKIHDDRKRDDAICHL
jgi:hypothetical protein